MEFSHMIYKVKDMDEAVKDFEDMGFTVIKDKVNSNIWFEDGLFIDLCYVNYSKCSVFLMKLIGLKGLAKHLQYYKDADVGFIDYSLENNRDDLIPENGALKKLGYKFSSFTMRKKYSTGEKLKWKITFPYILDLPFLVGAGSFKERMKPKGIVHKNGATGIEKVIWGVDSKYIEDINSLYDDKRLELVKGKGFQSIKINGYTGDAFEKKYYK
ncbi:MAG: VOC family protein [Tissierellia bacterium]|nr:VOC family protein [Tissierellia bacterium]